MSRARASWAPPLVAVLVLFALWELVVRIGLIPETSIPPASAAIPELFAQLFEGSLWKAVGNTLQGWALGLGIAVAAGVPAGLLVGSSGSGSFSPSTSNLSEVMVSLNRRFQELRDVSDFSWKSRSSFSSSW